ncbi:MAG: hypothetical protein IJ668_11965 [Selenomonadaceae bacterium]|nr:hypothetical protein [Selenomonadaceae bacterium]
MEIAITAIISATATASLSHAAYQTARKKGIDITMTFLDAVYHPCESKAVGTDYLLRSFLTHRDSECVVDCDISSQRLILSQKLDVRVSTVRNIDWCEDGDALYEQINAHFEHFKKGVCGRTFNRQPRKGHSCLDESLYQPGIELFEKLPAFTLAKTISFLNGPHWAFAEW